MNLNRLWALVKGELIRLNKYNVTAISVLVAILWGIILYFVDSAALASMLPFILMIDASMMSIMYIGSVMFFEKTESTISTMLVTPSTNSELVLSKVVANTIHNMLSSALIIIVFYFIKNIQINWFLIFLGVFAATAFHTVAGLFLAYYQKNFTGMLVNIMIIAFALMVPTALYQFNVLTADFWEYLLLINPVQSAAEVIGGGFTGYFTEGVFAWKYYFSLIYMLGGSVLLYVFLVLPKFHDYAVKQSGV
ncbi:ABC transporter permease [Candidatus Izemoplasma sp. B36]|uniref:ABC transporter permease n=1 Tax=Candidatus Izemoplasma sp. B36 TaxID=3242468 RepID=UPI003558F6F6